MPGVASIPKVALPNLRLLRWDDGTYMVLQSARYVDGQLEATFGNGDTVRVTPEALAPKRHARVRWSELRMVEDTYLEVPTDSGDPLEISGFAIREAHDQPFADYQDWAARYGPIAIGARMGELRRERGLTGEELAMRLGTTPQNISRLEHGANDPGMTQVQQFLTGLGLTWRNLELGPEERRRFEMERLRLFCPSSLLSATSLERLERKLLRFVAQHTDPEDPASKERERRLLGFQPRNLRDSQAMIERVRKELQAMPEGQRNVVCTRLTGFVPVLSWGGPSGDWAPEHIRELRTDTVRDVPKGQQLLMSVWRADYLARLELLAHELLR